ncbi:MAG: HEAT repeat domain-containing protein, partial [Planctomycetes bacterium]|nr:HEAT repeat domain-containing protein [Planctomycetota bacterium]
IKKDTRMANTRVLVVAKDVEKAKERFGDSVGVIQGPLTGEGLVAAVNTALEGVTTPSNLRAEAYASQASESLLAIASQKGDISGAIGNIAKQLNRGDAVAVPAAKALGLSGSAGELPALVAALGAGSLDLKKASAEAIGRVLGRMSDCPEDVSAALIEAMKADADVGLRQAIAIALGKAKLAADKKASLIESLKRIAATPTEG